MRNINIYAPIIGVLLIFLFGCSSESKLERLIEQELSSGIRHDSLFLGLKFGISKQAFYDHCWKLNREGVVKEGSRNMSVEYIFKDSLNQPVAFNFYAHENSDGLVHQYNGSFYYYAWALNRHLYSDRLIKILPDILMEWYGGNEPIAIIKDGKKHLLKVDGNRMIDVFIHNESTVRATYYDLSYPENQNLLQWGD